MLYDSDLILVVSYEEQGSLAGGNMSATRGIHPGMPGRPDFSLNEDDAFFLMRILAHLESESERQRLVDIVEKIEKLAQ